MALQQYCEDKRIVALGPGVSAYEAARALDENHVGAAIVQDAGVIVGILTDRDIAVRVTGSDIDPKEILVYDVMTPDPVTVAADDSEAHVLQLMRESHVRRIPIRDGTGVSGIVTLDDLILSQTVDSAKVAEVVAAQLAEPARLKPFGPAHPVRASEGDEKKAETRTARHAARAHQTMRRFVARLSSALGPGSRQPVLTDEQSALMAFQTVASGIVRRLTPEEARQFASQLPSEIKERLLDLPAGPDTTISRATITYDLAEDLGLSTARASELFDAVVASLPVLIDRGELDDVVAQLPRDMREAFHSGRA